MLSSVPAPVRSAWERILRRLDEEGISRSAVSPQVSRVSLNANGVRYLKYDYKQRQWVFCLGVGARMDEIDADRLCTRGPSGTRLLNAVARYDGDRLEPLLPILDRIVDLIADDCRLPTAGGRR